MDVFIARQPVFDRNMNVYGYELLYRYSKKNHFQITDDYQEMDTMVNETYQNKYFEELTSGTNAFVSFPNDLIIEKVPLYLESDTLVVEVLETDQINDEYILSLQKLRAKGYTIALDVFYFNQSFLPLLDVVDIVKIDFPKANMVLQKMVLKKYKNTIKFLAKRIETREDYDKARKMGYYYFQGYFFKETASIHTKDLSNINVMHIQILAELDGIEIDFEKLEWIIKKDVDLTKRILRLANSAQLGSSTKISSIKQALIRIGTKEFRKWIYLLMIKDLETAENKELLRTCLIRGRLMEQLAAIVGESEKMSSYFLTGTFSEIDNILNLEMATIAEKLSLSADITDALLGKESCIKEMLDRVIGFESHTMWPFSRCDLGKLTPELVMDNYIKALAWANEMGLKQDFDKP